MLDKVCLFEYNVGGNIVSKNEYAYTEGMIEGEPTKTYNYSYGDAWKDQLTNFDGQSIVYDTCGNPTSYLGATLAWSKGRLLTRFTKDSTTSRMTYDANGIRMSKLRVNHIDIVDSSYIYDSNGRLRTETEGAYTRRYLYSSDGIVGYEENGERYFYRKNLFGDITAIYQGATKLAEYVYDAWGNCVITFDTNGVGARNPMRYRGYYWDKDLKMYYLMTRYYDPKICRFINADTPDYLDPETLGGLNLYSYCKNNPVMCVDPRGNLSFSIDDASNILAVAIVIACFIMMASLLKKPTKPEGSNHKFFFDSNGPDVNIISPAIVNCDEDGESNGYGLEGYLYKLSLYFDKDKKNSLYLSLGNISMFAGVDLQHGIGIKGSVSGAELGYDGRIIDISVQGLTAGLGLMYSNGKTEIDGGFGWYGFSIDIDFYELINIFQ